MLYGLRMSDTVDKNARIVGCLIDLIRFIPHVCNVTSIFISM